MGKDGSETVGGKMDRSREEARMERKRFLIRHISLCPWISTWRRRRKEAGTISHSGVKGNNISARGTEAARRTPEERIGHRDAALITMCS